MNQLPSKAPTIDFDGVAIGSLSPMRALLIQKSQGFSNAFVQMTVMTWNMILPGPALISERLTQAPQKSEAMTSKIGTKFDRPSGAVWATT
jgi:hypothetical protein